MSRETVVRSFRGGGGGWEGTILEDTSTRAIWNVNKIKNRSHEDEVYRVYCWVGCCVLFVLIV